MPRRASSQKWAEAILQRNELSDEMLRRLGGIAALAGGVEFWSERAVWLLEGEAPAGRRPTTDGKPISALIVRIAKAGLNEKDQQRQEFIRLWCEVAGKAFDCRNRLFHGFAISFGPESGAGFLLNASWAQEERHRPSTTFHANKHTLAMLEETMAVLWRAGTLLATPSPQQRSAKTVERALLRVRLYVNEIVDLAAAVNHEKY